MKLPTNAEIECAYEEYGKEPPQAMAACIDRSPILKYNLEMFTRAFGGNPKLAVKSAMVAALQIGIRIGQNRRFQDS